MVFHPLSIIKSVLDPVHGLVRLTVEELKVINSPIFQRLRRIKQNGMLHYVFPAATHTRFEHSIGALYVADSVLESLYLNSKVAATKGEVGVKENEAFDLTSLEKSRTEFLFRTARLAALSHDLGHGPLSHTFEGFAPAADAVAELVRNHKAQHIKALAEIVTKFAEHGRVSHESMSCLLFALLWYRLSPEDTKTAGAVSAAILGEPDLAPEHKDLIPLINDIIASGPADADRMDYLERDTRSFGVSYGLYDRDRLLKSMLCYLDTAKEPRLGFKSSGFRAIENFVQARFELFVQVYFHKTNRAIELMLGRIAKLASEKKLAVMRQGSLEDLVSDYSTMGDDEFVDILRGVKESSVKDKDIHDLASRVYLRNLWRRVEDFREASVEEAAEKEFLERLSAQFKDVEFAPDVVEPKATKDLASGAALLFRDGDGVYRKRTGLSWSEESPIIKTLSEQEKKISRIYYCGDDAALARKIRLEALKLEPSFREKK